LRQCPPQRISQLAAVFSRLEGALTAKGSDQAAAMLEKQLVRLVSEPSEITQIPLETIPALLGSLEEIRTALWLRMLATAPTTSLHNSPDSSPEFLTVPEVAERLKFRPAYVYELARQKRIPSTREGKYVRIPRIAFEKWARNRASA